jgi:hypothetical protein
MGLETYLEIVVYSTGCAPNALLWAACAQLLARTPLLAFTKDAEEKTGRIG